MFLNIGLFCICTGQWLDHPLFTIFTHNNAVEVSIEQNLFGKNTYLIHKMLLAEILTTSKVQTYITFISTIFLKHHNRILYF